MAPSEPELFTRDEVLTGLPMRRARTSLFVIESHTARWVSQARQALDPFLTETTAAEREMSFVEAFVRGHAPPVRPTIQDLERYAPAWRNLAPEHARGRAALAQLLGQKYKFTAVSVPGIRAALALDDSAVQAAYERLFGQPLSAIYAPEPGPAERLRWASAGVARWFDSLPPFWTVFILTFTQTVGAAILALPIAFAGVGAIPGILVIAAFGLVNILTISAQAEAVARSGEMRYGTGFLGRMIETYLGRTGAGIAAVAIAADCIVTLLAFYSGFGTSLADATGLPAGLWAAGLFLVILFFLRRESLSATITSSLVIGAVNLIILAVIIVLALAHSRPENLGYMNVPGLSGGTFQVDILQVIFGVALGAYFGHLSVGNCARLVLSRDGSARSLTSGAAAAMGAAIVLYSIWVVAVNGAVPPAALANETGTALAPLATSIGPIVNLLGAVYVILAMAIVSVHFSLSLYNLVRERLPRHTEPVVWLPRRHGRLVLKPRLGRSSSIVSLTYLGLTGRGSTVAPRFRIDIQQGESVRRLEIAQDGCWNDEIVRRRWPELDRRVRMAVTVQASQAEGARLQVATPMGMRYEGEWDRAGLHMGDLLDLPRETRGLLTWLVRSGDATISDVAAYTGLDEASTRLLLADLVEQGWVEQLRPATGDRAATGGPHYRAQLAWRRGSRLPAHILAAVGHETPAEHAEGQTGRLTRSEPSRPQGLARLGPLARFWIAASPIAIIFLVTEALLWTGRASFVGLLSFLGVVIDSCLAGLFPVLLLYASRRKGEFVPGKVYQALGQPWLLGGIYLLFTGAILLHGLIIWQDPLQRVCAIAVGLFMLVATAVLIRNGAFAGRVVVEVCEDLRMDPKGGPQAEGQARFAITGRGEAAEAGVRPLYAAGERHYTAASGDLPDFGRLSQITFDLPPAAVRDVKVWAHRVTPDGMSESLPAVAELRCENTVRTADLRLSGGQAVLPRDGAACQLTLRFETADEAAQDRRVALAEPTGR